MLVFVKPADGVQVPDPDRGGYLPADGAWKNLDVQFWARREAAGEIVRATAPVEPVEATEPVEAVEPFAAPEVAE